MKLKFRRKGQQGLTLLEIMVAIAVLTSTLVAFASVFPAAFKLNRQSQNSVKAAKYAAAVAEELRALPIANSSYLASSGMSDKRYLENYDYATNGQSVSDFDDFCKKLVSAQELKDAGFFLDYENARGTAADNGIGENGLIIMHNGKGGHNDSRFWQIEVNVFWPETINGKKVVRSSSVISARTGNR